MNKKIWKKFNIFAAIKMYFIFALKSVFDCLQKRAVELGCSPGAWRGTSVEPAAVHIVHCNSIANSIAHCALRNWEDKGFTRVTPHPPPLNLRFNRFCKSMGVFSATICG